MKLIKPSLHLLYYTSLIYFTYLMFLITVQYIPIRIDVAFLNVKEEVAPLLHYQIAFFSHVFTSIFVLILGIPQFSLWVRRRYANLHKLFGKFYILLILAIASPSGLVMAYYANGGFWSIVSFCLQAVLWFFYTWKAYKAIRRKDWLKHENFMLRSYAMTLSAISLRLFKWIIVSTLELPPMDTYRIVSWAWVVNILAVEIYIKYKQNQSDERRN